MPTESSRRWATLDTRTLATAFLRRGMAACPEQRHMVMPLLLRLRPRRWTLEWYLPWWLGQSIGVDRATARAIVLSNVLGLGALRLEDDLADGDVPAADVAGTRALAAALLDEALAVYRERFPAGSPLWPLLDDAVGRWRTATAATGAHAVAPGVAETSADGDAALLQPAEVAARGAPLQVGAAALCLIAGRQDLLDAVAAVVHHALTAWVLYDDAKDWQADVAAGRRNAFVARLTRDVPAFTPDDTVRHRVLLALLTTDGARDYFAEIARAAACAVDASDALGLAPLSRHLRRFARVTAASGRRQQTHYHALAERATVLLFGDGAA